MNNSQKKAQLTYHFDALCGWCYGFSSAINQLHEKYQDTVDFNVISGGLFSGDRAGRINDVAPHIKAGAYKRVEDQTGIKFGKPFLDDVFGDGKMTLDSLWPAIAFYIVKERFPEQTMAFAKILTDAVHADGIDPINLDAYAQLAAQVGFTGSEAFNRKMKNEKYKELALQGFQFHASSDVRYFPSVTVETKNGKSLLAEGSATFEELDKRLSQFLEQ